MKYDARKPRGKRSFSWSSLLLLAIALLLGRWSEHAVWAQTVELLDGIAAVVNDEILTISEVREAVALETEQLRQQYRGGILQQKQKELYSRALTNLINIRLQLDRARKLNLQVQDEDVTFHIDTLKKQNQISDEQLVQMLKSRGLTLEAYRSQVREGLLVAKVVNAEVRSRLVILDTELQEAYQKGRQAYKVPGELTVSHILFLVSESASERTVERARKKAEMVLQKLRSGGDFAALARQYSEGPSSEGGGLLGTFRTGELLPGFEQVAAALSPGETSDIVRTRAGFHIIRVEAKKEGAYKPFEEVQEEIKSALLSTKTEHKYLEWLKALRQSAYIRILYEG